MKNKKGFTLIELLAVIIILGVLMIIAVPSVTKYINESKKNGYVSTAKELAGSARTLAYSGNYTMDDKDTTYYIDGECLKTENAYRSPYGKFEHAYVAVTATDKDHEYYWFSVDETGTGVKSLTNVEKLEIDSIESGIEAGEITPTIGIDKRSKIIIYQGENCTKTQGTISQTMNSKTGKIKNACPASYTPTIYWALQDTTSDGHYDKLVISDSEVSGNQIGNFAGNSSFSSYGAPWKWNDTVYYISNIEIVGTVAPTSTAKWFHEVGWNAETFTSNLEDLETCHVTNMSQMFYYTAKDVANFGLDLSNWDTRNVTDMSSMFEYSGINANTINLNLSDWDTSKVTSMSYMFNYAGEYSTNWSLVGLNTWDMSNVVDVENMFYYAGYNASIFDLNLSNWNLAKVNSKAHTMFSYNGQHSATFKMNVSGWNTSNITNMRSMFYRVGEYAPNWSIIGLNTWDTSNVTDLSSFFFYAGYNAENFNIDISNWNLSKVEDIVYLFDYAGKNSTNYNVVIPKTNGNGVNNTTNALYGKTTSIISTPPEGKSFTVAT